MEVSLDITVVAYHIGKNVGCCHAWDNNHCLIYIYMKVYTKNTAKNWDQDVFPFLVEDNSICFSHDHFILSLIILYSFTVCCLFYLPIAFFMAPLSPDNFAPPALLPHLTPFSSFLRSSSLSSPSLPSFSSSRTSSILPGPLWQIPLLCFHT